MNSSAHVVRFTGLRLTRSRLSLGLQSSLVLLASLALPSCGGGEEKSEADKLYDECLGNAMGDPQAEMQCYLIKAQAEAGQMGGIVGEGGDEASGANDQLPETAGEFVACATGGASADVEVSSMLLVVDKSSSMNDNNKWNQATAALVSFLQSPETSGLSIGLRFYPDDFSEEGGTPLCNMNDCDIDSCSQPHVESAELTDQGGAADPQETALVQAIQGTTAWADAGRGTPTYAALGGGLNWARTYQSTHAGESAIVVLVTDGEPNGCNDNNTAIAGLAAEAFQTDDVRTYAIGLEGSQEAQMDEIAEAGGTNSGVFIGSENAEQDLLEALAGIRGEVLGCEFPVPDPENGELNPDQVNIVLTSNGTDTQFSKVQDEGQCGEELSWYFASGNSIELCPAACNVTLADPNASIGLVFGCNTGEPVITGEQAR